MKYEEKIEKLEKIVSDIESGELSVDLLSEKVKEATSLIEDCRSILLNVQKDVNKILSEANKKE